MSGLEINRKGKTMKTIVMTILFVTALCIIGSGYAQNAERTSIGLGVEYRTKTMDMEITQISPEIPELDVFYQAFDIQQEYSMPVASVHLKFLNNVDFAFLFGLIDYDLTQESEQPGFSHDFSCDSTSAFGFGGKIAFALSEKILVGFNFEHFTTELDEFELSSEPPAMSFVLDNRNVTIDSLLLDNLKYHETTLTPMVSMKWGRFTPYIGPRFTAAKADMDVTYLIGTRELDRTIKYDPMESWSLVAGVDVWITDNLSLIAEFETVNNESYKIGLAYTF
jgi:hypothetical protein